MTRKRKGNTKARRLWRVALYAVAVAIVAYLFGFGYFVQAIGGGQTDRATKTDAIVVLTGGSGRIAAGVELLQAGLARHLFISGVNRDTDAAELARLTGQSAALFKCCVTMGYQATNTVGNAEESAAWISKNGYKSLRLVTSNYHMPRALLDFRTALPDVAIVPDPVAAKPSPGLHPRLVFEYNKYLVMLARYQLESAP